jgi:hypothetical protein
MIRRIRPAALLLAATILSVGCGSAAGPATAPSGPAAPPSLATSLVTATGTWAVTVMGGPAASHNNFWQLFVRPTGTTTWRLATPPGVASNGGLVITGLGAGSVVAGFRPSQDLSYSPLATTRDNGTAWTSSLLDAALADVPGALAAAPGGGRMLALLANGTAELSGPGGTPWEKLATRQALAASAAGTRCTPGSLTAAAFSPAGTPMLAASCTRPGTAGIFAYASGTWHPAGPALPATFARQNVTVLQLTTTAGTTTSLLTAGTGPATRLLAAWSTDGGTRWTVSPPLPLHGATLASASTGPGATIAIVLNTHRAWNIAGPAAPWQQLPALPAGTATLAPGPTSGWDALAVRSTKLTVWRLAPGRTAWAPAQTMNVPIQFGSSG